MKDDFGDRMKEYEAMGTSARVRPEDYLCVRIDGKTFSKFTKEFEKPFDPRLSDAMEATTEFLVEQTHANIGYTQSDEITLIYSLGDKATEHIFGGKLSKINSILASMATAKFNSQMKPSYFYNPKLAFFDCRAWGMPNNVEASNVLLWRVQDARKNSVSAMFRWTLGSKAMHGLNQAQMKEQLFSAGHDWYLLPNRWKYGTYIKRVPTEVKLEPEILAKIPESKRPQDGIVTRTVTKHMDYGYFGDMTLEERVNAISR